MSLSSRVTQLRARKNGGGGEIVKKIDKNEALYQFVWILKIILYTLYLASTYEYVLYCYTVRPKLPPSKLSEDLQLWASGCYPELEYSNHSVNLVFKSLFMSIDIQNFGLIMTENLIPFCVY